MKHTPSPWTNIGTEIRQKNTSLILANVYKHLEANQPTEERKANAKLMAAAPELLDALIEIKEYAEEFGLRADLYEVLINAYNKATL